MLYRVTPVYDGVNLVARGVQLEALSMEDNGEGICFNVYVYNNQPGVLIDYTTGESSLLEDWEGRLQSDQRGKLFVLNTNSKKFHLASCSQADSISSENKDIFEGDRQSLLEQDYTPAGCCNP